MSSSHARFLPQRCSRDKLHAKRSAAALVLSEHLMNTDVACMVQFTGVPCTVLEAGALRRVSFEVVGIMSSSKTVAITESGLCMWFCI